jgi:chromosomal replication initiator protein
MGQGEKGVHVADATGQGAGIAARNPWLLAQEGLRSALDEHSYDNWFSQTRFESYQNGLLTVLVPSQFFANWLREHFQDTISKTLREILPDFREVQYVPTSEPSPRNTPARQNSAQTPTPKPRLHGASREKVSANAGRLLGFNERYTFDRFVIGSGNRFAHAAAKAVVESPARAYNPLFLYGHTGLGKTHLMHAIGQELLRREPERNIVFISSELFTNQLIESIAKKSTPKFRAKYRHADVLLIDDIHFIAGKEATQEEFFHTFNELYDMHKQIVLCSDRGPKEIHRMEERLVSRFEWGLVTDIQAPDFETRMAILQNKAAEERVTLDPEVVRFIATVVTSNIRELEGALVTVLAYSKLTGQDITAPMVEQVLHDIIGRSKLRTITFERIQKVVAEHFDVRIVDMRGRNRQRQIAYPRQIAMYLCKGLIPNMTLSEIGEVFGGKDHTTVLYACHKIKEEIDRDDALRQVLVKIENDLRE